MRLQVDQSGRGALTPADINGFLTELGLEPTSSDVLHIIDELDWSSSGIVSRWGLYLKPPMNCVLLPLSCFKLPLTASQMPLTCLLTASDGLLMR